MLQGEPEPLDLEKIAAEYKEKIAAEFNFAEISEDKPVTLHYPVKKYPEKVSSYNLDKQPEIQDTLLGLKGQYMIFSKNVLNLKKYAGYMVSLEQLL